MNLMRNHDRLQRSVRDATGEGEPETRSQTSSGKLSQCGSGPRSVRGDLESQYHTWQPDSTKWEPFTSLSLLEYLWDDSCL